MVVRDPSYADKQPLSLRLTGSSRPFRSFPGLSRRESSSPDRRKQLVAP